LKINFAHVRHPGVSGRDINFVVFDASSRTGSSGNADVLAALTMKARGNGLKVDQSALAFVQHGQLRFFGDRHLVDFLSKNGLPRWTHMMDV
jgi:hypothetical protein